jgi:hypothetical protein
MVKQSVFPMDKIFTSDRFGSPQVFAGILLLIFIAECAWLMGHENTSVLYANESDLSRIAEGMAQWRGRGIAGTPSMQHHLDPATIGGTGYNERQYDEHHSPLWYLIASAPVSVIRVSPDSSVWVWLTRGPYIFFGVMLGASLWYVSRRLYGNAGGYIALGLYCFSPAVIRNSSLWLSGPNIGAAWGTFGAVFTAIAVSHTLYAPREVVLWNWRRTLLLGVSLALAIGSHWGLAIVIPLLLAFMLYLAPERKGAVGVILAAACCIAFLILFSSYFFHARSFGQGMAHAYWLEASWRSAQMPGAYLQVVREIAESGPVLIVLLPASVAVYLAWGRTRYFGNSTPLIVAGLFLALRVLSPHQAGSIFSLAAIVFLLVFVAGIAADLLETRWRDLAVSVFAGLLAANALWNLVGLARIAR